MPGDITLTYSHIERFVIGGAMPVGAPLTLDEGARTRHRPVPRAARAGRHQRRRRPAGSRSTARPTMSAAREGLYVPMGTADVVFESDGRGAPGQVLPREHAGARALRDGEDHARDGQADADGLAPRPRTSARIYQYVDPDVCQLCQLLLGLTVLKPGSVWNTMPPPPARPALRDLLLLRPAARRARVPLHGRAGRDAPPRGRATSRP